MMDFEQIFRLRTGWVVKWHDIADIAAKPSLKKEPLKRRREQQAKNQNSSSGNGSSDMPRAAALGIQGQRIIALCHDCAASAEGRSRLGMSAPGAGRLMTTTEP